jgi:transcriptional regulator with XRE-family HTH domain
MVRNPGKNFLRAWREHRRMTQAKLAELVGTTGAVISLLESGDRGLSDKWLRKLAPVLGTTPGHLLDIHPDEASDDLFEIWRNVPEENRAQARIVLKTFERPPPSRTVVGAVDLKSARKEQQKQTPKQEDDSASDGGN